jgi:hypothetical protein
MEFFKREERRKEGRRLTAQWKEIQTDNRYRMQ